MAKMVKKKKKNYRLRKSVRRTLGALFMISAIIVAAIPFPDAAATNGEVMPIEEEDNNTVTQLPELNYNPDSNLNLNINKDKNGNKINLDNNGKAGESTYGQTGSNTQRAFTLLDIEGNWYYEWQFEFYVLDGTTHAIINYYNRSYSTPNITLKQTINTGYDFIEAFAINEYFEDPSKGGMSITIDTTNYNLDPASDDGYYIRKYFNDACTSIANQLKELEEDKITEIVPVVVSPANLKESLRIEYYGEKECGLRGTGFGLQEVLADNSIVEHDNTAGPYNKIYIIRRMDSQAERLSGYSEDANGFLYTSSNAYILKGIGDEAFYDVDNVQSIEMSSQIEYIGESAFENASLVQSIVLGNTREIGNRAFKDCTELVSVELKNGLNNIGTEAFSGTKLEDITFPGTINTIGYGAFSKNQNLKTITFLNSNSVTIDDYAFYNCPSLGNIDFEEENIIRIGEGAFAISNTLDNGTCTEFVFPRNLMVKTKADSYTEQLPKWKEFGDMILAGRTALEKVVMPAAMGSDPTVEVTLPLGTFKKCNSLSTVIFPETSVYVKFAENIFTDVENSGFYVEGPALLSASKEDPAYPRESTWSCYISNGNEVPYKYTMNGKTYYEVKSDDYLLSLLINEQDKTAIVGQCILAPKGKGGTLEIRDEIGGYRIIELGDGCISEEVRKGDPENNNNGAIEKLIIGDSVTKLGDSVFEDCPKLNSISLGDGITTIGSRTFAKCPELASVNIGAGVTAIGNETFMDCEKLSYIKFEEPINGSSSFPVANIGERAFCTNSPSLVMEGLIDSEYGPFNWAMNKSNYANGSMGIRPLYKSTDHYELGKDTANKVSPSIYVILDDATGLATAIHYPHYNDLEDIYSQKNPAQTLCEAYEAGTELTPAEQRVIESALHVEFFPGIESIDVSGYMNAKENSMNVATYMELASDDTQDTEIKEILPYSATYREFGLFNGNYGDPTEGEYGSNDPDNESYEKENRGNDTVESVTMHTVKYLPNVDELTLGDVENRIKSGAFYSCEKLQKVVLGSGMEDVGTSPFLDCYSLEEVVCDGNNSYKFDNKILYGVKPDGSLKLVQVLATRGMGNRLNEATDSNIINVSHDPLLAEISEMGEGSMMHCPYLFEVDFTGADNFRKIPDDAMRGSSSSYLNVILPQNVREVGHRAFADMNTIVVTIDGDEVSLASDLFENSITPIVYAYEDSAAYNTAKNIKNPVVQVISRDKNCKVRFLDWGGQVISEQFVPVGGNAEKPDDPTREGYTFTGWDKPHKNITESVDIYATYEIDKESPYWDNIFPGSDTDPDKDTDKKPGQDSDDKDSYDEDGNKLYTLTVQNGMGSGKYPAGKKVVITADAPPAGSGFANWSSENNDLMFEDRTKSQTTISMPNSNATVTANFTGYYTLEVVYGSGSGLYPAGASVSISAVAAPQGRSFASWVVNTSDLKVENVRSINTKVTMPAKNAKVTATYMDNRTLSGNSTGSSKNNTSIVITKPGISNKDVASAYVSGSSDNFIVKISESLEAADEVQKALQKKYPDMTRIKYFAMDISLYDAKGVNKITDTTGLKVNITMPIPDALREYAGNNRVGAVVNGELETLNPKFTTINGVPSITFTATHFSPYTIYVDTGNLTVSNTLDSTPKTGDGIHPKWFVSIALACISIILFTKKDRRYAMKAYR